MKLVACMTSKGQITIPGKVRKQMGWGQGKRLLFVVLKGGKCEISLLKDGCPLEGILASRHRRRKPVSIEQMNRDIESGDREI